ncbi:MAG: deoxynucleoside kinase [Candidatus Eutrophobiaceae bacterium]
MLNNFKHIAIEGPIGVGKTTLARRLAERLEYSLLLEDVEGNPFLPRFYTDRKSMALPTQLFFLLQRAKGLEEMRQNDLFRPEQQISDFLPAKDQLFAKTTLSDDEYHLYLQVCSHLDMQQQQPDFVIFLYASPENILTRILKRGRYYETAVEIDYLRAIHNAYVEFFHRYDDAPMLLVNTDNFNLADGKHELDILLEHIKCQTARRSHINPLKLA